jgi:hypothetical protein
MRGWMAGAMIVAAATAMPARAQSFDAGDPARIADALRTAGYKAELKKNDAGDPYIASAANGSDFTIDFYGCQSGTKCGSFQFFSYYKKDPLYTLPLINEWNAGKRFLKLRIDQDGDLAYSMDVTAVGTMTQETFADWVDWFEVMDGELSKFLEGKRTAAKQAG